MSLRGTLDILSTTIERATSVPLSASCVVNRGEVLALIEQARGELPQEMAHASDILAEREQVLAEATRQADEVVAAARQRASELVGENPLVQRAQVRAEQLLDAARADALRLSRDADDYCDRRLAELELNLQRAMAQLRRGRDRLQERRDNPAARRLPEPARSTEDMQPAPAVIDLTAAEREGSAPLAGLGTEQHLQ